MGNIVTKHPVQKILLKASGVSTIGGKQMWFDHDIDRLNEDGRGELLGEFRGDEHILAVCRDGSFYTTGLDLSTRFQGDLLHILGQGLGLLLHQAFLLRAERQHLAELHTCGRGSPPGRCIRRPLAVGQSGIHPLRQQAQGACRHRCRGIYRDQEFPGQRQESRREDSLHRRSTLWICRTKTPPRLLTALHRNLFPTARIPRTHLPMTTPDTEPAKS